MDARTPPPRSRILSWALAGTAAAAAAAAAGLLALSTPPARAATPPLPARLSETGLFAAPGSREIAPGNRPYAPQYPLWTDGAAKRRWIHLPEGSTIDARDPDAWQFPVGTRLWKEFAFGRPVETRYIERLADGRWRFASYQWTPDGQDAVLAPPDGVAGACEARPGVPHDIPSRDACLACHGNGPTPVLGFSALQLSPDRDALAPHAEPVPRGAVDLAVLAAEGRLAGLPADLVTRPPRVPSATPAGRAALGYLHANCGACHAAQGPAARLGLDLEVRLGGERPAALRTALGVPSRFRFEDGDAAALRIAAGDPGRSVLARRMAVASALARMPPLGSRVPDEQAIALVERWIRDDLPASGSAASLPPSPVHPLPE